MTAVYRWKPGAHAKVDAQTAGEELERIRTHHNGRLDPERVVALSRPEGSRLHGCFEWDDAVAAGAYRVEQAKYLIRGIEVVLDSKAEAAPIRAFVSVTRDTDRCYTSTVHALADTELRAQVLDRAWRELEAWRQRHAELVELARVFSVIDQARGA